MCIYLSEDSIADRPNITSDTGLIKGGVDDKDSCPRYTLIKILDTSRVEWMIRIAVPGIH